MSGVCEMPGSWRLPPGTLVFERPSRNRTRIDLWIGRPHNQAIEVKCLRTSGSGCVPSLPMHYGQVLADFNKVAQVPCQAKLVVIAADERWRPMSAVYPRCSGPAAISASAAPP